MLRRCSNCDTEKPLTEFNRMSAAKDGLQRYCRACQRLRFNEYQACPNNHARMVERQRNFYAENREVISEKRKKSYRSNPACNAKVKARARAWAISNSEKVSERMARYREEMAERISVTRRSHREKNAEAISAYDKEYRANNRPKIRQINAKRRAAKSGASVGWASKSMIELVYVLAEQMTTSTGIEHQVDHIVPLVSDIVCGLHCENNLQVIPKSQNISKGNRYWPDMPE